MGPEDKLRLDYEQTNEQIRTLTDIRFKLLAFVPTLTGAAVALLTKSTNSATALAVGLLGLFVTLGIVFYERRNTVIYRAAIRRARHLEDTLNLPRSTDGEGKGGLFNETPGPPVLFEKSRLFKMLTQAPGLEVWHERGLALVYGTALGGWVYVIVYSLLTLLGLQKSGIVSLAYTSLGLQRSGVIGLASILLAGIVAFLYIRPYYRSNNRPDPAFNKLLPALRQRTSAPIMLPAELPKELKNVAIREDTYEIGFFREAPENIVESGAQADMLGTLRVSLKSESEFNKSFEATRVETVRLPDGTKANLRYLEPVSKEETQGAYWEGKFNKNRITFTLTIYSEGIPEDSVKQALSTMVSLAR